MSMAPPPPDKITNCFNIFTLNILLTPHFSSVGDARLEEVGGGGPREVLVEGAGLARLQMREGGREGLLPGVPKYRTASLTALTDLPLLLLPQFLPPPPSTNNKC